MATNDDLISRIKQSRIGKAVSNVLSDSAQGYKNAGSMISRGVSRVAQNPQQYNIFSKQSIQSGLAGGQYLSSRLKQATNVPQQRGRLDDITRSAGNFSGNLIDTLTSGLSDITNSVYSDKKDYRTPFRAVRGFGKIATPFVPASGLLYQGANLISSYDKQIDANDRLRRTSAGFLQGISQNENVAQNVPSKETKLNIPVIGEVGFDPYKTAGSMAGFVKNPVNQQLFKGTEAIFSTASAPLKRWLATTAARGALEQIILDIPDAPDNMSERDKINWVVTKIGEGALSEIVGQGIFKTIGAGANKVINSNVSKKLVNVFNEMVDIKKKPETTQYIKQLRDNRGRFSRTGAVQEPLIGVDGKPFEPQKTVLQERPDGTGMSLIPRAKSRLKELMKDKPGFIDLSAKVGAESKPTKGVEPLIEEARKYKSAEEFIKAKVNAYHGTDKEFTKFDLSKAGSTQGLDKYGMFFTDQPNVARTYSSLYPEKPKYRWTPDDKLQAKKAIVMEAYVNDANPLTLQEVADLYKQGKIKTKPNLEGNVRPSSYFDLNREAIKEAMDVTGKDVFTIKAEGQKFFAVNNQDKMLSKSQLTDIYNQAKGETIVNPLTGETIPKPTGRQAGFIDFGADVGKQKEVRLKPETQKIINDARSEIGIAKEEKGRGIKQIANDLYTQWVNRYAPVERASQFAKKKLKTQNASLRPENDPEYLVRRFTGAGGIASERFNNVLKPIIDELDARKIDKVDMDAYLKAKRDIGLGERNILGSDTNLASKRVVALMEKYPGIDEVANKLYKYQNDGFQEMIDAGFLSKDSADVIRQQNPDYVPFQRVMDDLDNYLGIPSNKLQQGTSPIQKIKGSKRQIVSPIESVIANTFKQRAAIEKNRVAKSIVDLQKVAPELGFEQMKKSTPETITIWNDGKKEYWKVGSEIADTVKAVNEESTNALLKIFQAPASLLRQGATGRNPDFLIPNVVKDQFDAGISSKYGYIPFIDYVSGLKSMIGNDEIYQKWANSGAKIDLGEISGRKSISKSFDQAAKRKGLMGWIGTGLDKLGTISEVPTRVGLFKKAYKKTGNELIAAMESRDATVDFARMGSKMKTANSIIPFLNVGVQGFDKIMRQAKNNPGKLALNAGIYAALPTITTTLYNLLNHGEEYSEIPQYVKDSNFVFVSGRNNDGTVDYFTIPKGNIAPLITNPIENFLTYLYGQNESTLAEFATQFISSALPVLGDGSSVKEVATKTIGQNLPQLIKPPIEGLLNRSFYKYDPEKEQSKEIVSSYLKNKEPYQQDYEWTPKTYKKIGAALNVSPLSVQHYLESYLAGYTKVPTQVIGILDDISSGNEIRKNDIPILRRFMSTTFPSSTKKTTKTEEKRTGFMERVTGKVSASEKTPPAVVTKEAIDDIKKRVKEGERVSNTELDIAYLGKIENLPSSNRYDKSIKDNKLYAAFGNIENDEYLTEDKKQALYGKIARELNTASAPTKIGSLEVSTRETDNFPFPDFNSSAPGQTLRADLNFSGVGDADIVLHFKTPSGKVISVPQTRESFNGNKQEYGLEMNIPKDSGYGTGEIWATVNGKEVSGTRKKHQILNTQAVNRYASGSTPEEFQANQQQIDKLRSTNPTFSRDINRNITIEDLKTYQVAKDEVPRKTLYVYDQMDSMQSKDELMAFLAQGRRPINGQILISDGVIDNLVSDGVIPYELGKELKKYDLNEDGTQKSTKKTSSGGSSKKGTTKNDQEIAKIKAYGKYLDSIKNITPTSGYPQGKIPTTKINVQGLTFGS